MLIRNSIIFIIPVVSDSIEATILRLEDTGGVATTRIIVEIAGRAITAVPITIVTDFTGTLSVYTTKKGADIAAAPFLKAIYTVTVSGVFSLKAAFNGFYSSDYVLVGNILRFVIEEYTILLMYPRIL